MKSDRELIDDVINYLDVYGWTQRAAVDDQGKCCLLTAVERIVGHVMIDPAAARIYNRLRDFVGDPLAVYNDEPGRTKDEVIAKLGEFQEQCC